MICLKDHAYGTVSKSVFFANREVVDSLSIDPDFTTIGCIKEPHYMEQGAFSRATLANNGKKTTFLKRKVNTTKNLKSSRSGLILFTNLSGF
jgi:hypothetical protein